MPRRKVIKNGKIIAVYNEVTLEDIYKLIVKLAKKLKVDVDIDEELEVIK